VASFGLKVFSDEFQGYSEAWVRWSYRELPEKYRNIFEGGGGEELVLLPVEKIRGVRKVRVDPMTAEATEIPASTPMDRGVSVELTNLRVDGGQYCSLGFEAFPDDAAMIADFTRVVEGFLATLDGVSLDESNSLSYPGWLSRLVAERATTAQR
jgi:hypothetical protein